MGIPEAIALLFLSYIITMSSIPKTRVDVQKPAAFEDFDFPQSEEGTPQSVVFGEVWSGDWMVLDVGNYRTTAITKSGGGKK